MKALEWKLGLPDGPWCKVLQFYELRWDADGIAWHRPRREWFGMA